MPSKKQKKVSLHKLVNDYKKECLASQDQAARFSDEAYKLRQVVSDQQKKISDSEYQLKDLQFREHNTLVEIIRWMINPATTAYPFSKSKDEGGNTNCIGGRGVMY